MTTDLIIMTIAASDDLSSFLLVTSGGNITISRASALRLRNYLSHWLGTATTADTEDPGGDPMELQREAGGISHDACTNMTTNIERHGPLTSIAVSGKEGET